MFDSVKNALEGGGFSIEEGGVFLLTESLTTSASGLIVHFLTQALANSQHICFVSLQHTWGHYCNIGMKCGINLRHQAVEGKIKVIEPLKLMTEILHEGSENVDHPFHFVLKPSEHSLRNLYRAIAATVEPWKLNGEKFTVVIDGMSSLLNLGVCTKEIDIFFNYCKSLIESSSCSFDGTLLIVTTSHDKDEDASHIVNKIAQSSVIHLSLEGLSTGLSREVHGNLRITFKSSCPHICTPDIKLFQFKAEDKNIKLFAPGTSSGVL